MISVNEHILNVRLVLAALKWALWGNKPQTQLCYFERNFRHDLDIMISARNSKHRCIYIILLYLDISHRRATFSSRCHIEVWRCPRVNPELTPGKSSSKLCPTLSSNSVESLNLFKTTEIPKSAHLTRTRIPALPWLRSEIGSTKFQFVKTISARERVFFSH